VHLASSIREALDEKKAWQSEFPGRPFKLQRAIAERLRGKVFEDDVAKTIKQRVEKYYPDNLEDFTREHLERLRAFSLSLPSALSMQLLRVWANGLCTSHRFHECVALPPLCGCTEGRDTQQHYFGCLFLRRLLGDLFRQSLPESDLEALGLWNVQTLRAIECYILVCAYNGVKDCSVDKVLAAIGRGNRSAVFKVWAEQFYQAALSMYLRTDLKRLFPKQVFFPRVGVAFESGCSECSSVLVQVHVPRLAAPVCLHVGDRNGGFLVQ